MLRQARTLILLAALLPAVPAVSSNPPGSNEARVEVCCSRASAFVNVSITSYRRIGTVTLEVRDEKGVTWFKEEGKALTPELVRRLDKGGFHRGRHTLIVTARDFTIEQPFLVE